MPANDPAFESLVREALAAIHLAHGHVVGDAFAYRRLKGAQGALDSILKRAEDVRPH